MHAMRKHGWQLPYHPLQVVAVAVFLALGFAFYVFFAPFVGKQVYQLIAMGIYSPLLISSFSLYIWCAAVDPSDPGVLRSKHSMNVPRHEKHSKPSKTKHGGGSTFSFIDGKESNDNIRHENKNCSDHGNSRIAAMLALLPCAYICCLHEESSDQQNEDGMFYCSLCEVEVSKYSKHCRVCDKCIDHFDHHCRWLNNCIGKKNYRKFFTLMVSALLLLVLQWSTGILVLILCFLDRNQFAFNISSKLGSSFTVAPFVIVVSVCTVLAMIATLPLTQLFFFHILLIKKGIGTYDYIIALREQELQVAGSQQSPQMSPVSSLTRLSSMSSFNTFNHAAFCSPPRLFVEDQFDVMPPDNASMSSLGKKIVTEELSKKKHPAAIKISPWVLARLNAEDVSKAATEARMKSRILQSVARHETESSISIRGDRIPTMPKCSSKRGSSQRICLPIEMPPSLGPHVISDHRTLTSPQAQIAFNANQVISSPDSSLNSPDLYPPRISPPRAAKDATLVEISTSTTATQDIPLSRSTSDGYDASGGEDSDQGPTRIVHRSSNWSSLLVGSEPNRTIRNSMPWSSTAFSDHIRH